MAFRRGLNHGARSPWFNSTRFETPQNTRRNPECLSEEWFGPHARLGRAMELISMRDGLHNCKGRGDRIFPNGNWTGLISGFTATRSRSAPVRHTTVGRDLRKAAERKHADAAKAPLILTREALTTTHVGRLVPHDPIFSNSPRESWRPCSSSLQDAFAHALRGRVACRRRRLTSSEAVRGDALRRPCPSGFLS